MKRRTIASSSAFALAVGLLGTRLAAQSSQAEKEAAVAAHIQAARKAAGKEHTGIFEASAPSSLNPPPAARPLPRNGARPPALPIAPLGMPSP